MTDYRIKDRKGDLLRVIIVFADATIDYAMTDFPRLYQLTVTPAWMPHQSQVYKRRLDRLPSVAHARKFLDSVLNSTPPADMQVEYDDSDDDVLGPQVYSEIEQFHKEKEIDELMEIPDDESPERMIRRMRVMGRSDEEIAEHLTEEQQYLLK